MAHLAPAFAAPVAASSSTGELATSRSRVAACSAYPPSNTSGPSRQLKHRAGIASSTFFCGSSRRIQFRALARQPPAAQPEPIRSEMEPDAMYEDFYKSLQEGGPVQGLNEDGTIEIRMPQSLEEGVFQAKVATQTAFNAGQLRLQVEIFLPDLLNTFGGLKIAIPLVREYARAFEPLGEGLKIVMPDAGAAALARKEWEGEPFRVAAVGDPFEEDKDTALLIVAPDSYQVYEVEELVNAACPLDPETGKPLPNARPVIFFNPNLEDLAVVGIGLAARQIRDRFLNTFEQAYYVKAVDSFALLKIYPGKWMLHVEEPEEYRLVAEVDKKPAQDRIEEVLSAAVPSRARSGGLLSGLSSFFKALSR